MTIIYTILGAAVLFLALAAGRIISILIGCPTHTRDIGQEIGWSFIGWLATAAAGAACFGLYIACLNLGKLTTRLIQDITSYLL